MDNIAPRIGFIGWNPFQLLHVRKLIAALPGACFVIEHRKDYINEFDENLLNDPAIPVLVWSRKDIAELDGVFDVLVCQTPFTKIQEFKKTRIAMIQYGYAKEAHNYGPWRAFADLTLAYGAYAAEKIAHFSPVATVGNPRYDDWHDPAFHIQAKKRYGEDLDKSKTTVLYAPTWGDLSSVDKFLGAVYSLAEKHNVLVKMHHNTELLEASRKSSMSHPGIRHLGANDDLLELMAVSDVVISDYSGAIFDAMYCRKPLVLLNTDIEALMGNKIDVHSIEYARRESIGLVVSEASQLSVTVDRAVTNAVSIVDRSEVLRSQLFVDVPGATQRAVNALLDVAAGTYGPTQSQSYVRKDMKEFYEAKAMLAAIKAGAKSKAKKKK